MLRRCTRKRPPRALLCELRHRRGEGDECDSDCVRSFHSLIIADEDDDDCLDFELNAPSSSFANGRRHWPELSDKLRSSTADMASTTTSATKSAVKPTGTTKVVHHGEEKAVDFVILGITLGSIAGLILLVLAVLWIIKCIRQRRNPKVADKKDSAGDAERANGNGSAMAIVLTAVTSPSSTNPPRLLSHNKRHDRNRTLGSSAGGSTSSAGRMGKGSISNPTYVPHTTTDAFSQKNYKHFPISRPLPVHQHQGSFGSQSGRLAGPIAGSAVNFAHLQRPPVSRGNGNGRGVHFPPSNVVRPLQPSVVGAAPVLIPRQGTTLGVLAPPSSSSGGATITSSGVGVGVGVGVGSGQTTQRNGSTRRSSGWNRYWSGGSALNMMGFNQNSGKEDRKSTYTSQSETQPSDQESVYSTDTHGQRVVSNHQAFIPPPLNFAQSGTRMSQVSTGSPIIHPENSRGFPLQTGRVGHIRRTSSVSSLSSYGEDPIDAFSSGVPTSEPEAQQWNPLAAHDWNGNRGTSSVYTDENYTHTPQRATLVDSYYAKSHSGHQYDLKLPQQGQTRDEYEPNVGRQRQQQPKQHNLKPPAQSRGYQRQQRQETSIVPDLVDEYGRPHIYPTHQQQQYHQQQRMNERGNDGAQQRHQQQRLDERRYDGAQYPYPSSRTQHAQRGAPDPRSDDMSWLNLGR